MKLVMRVGSVSGKINIEENSYIGRKFMPVSIDNLIKILPAIMVILIGIWLLKIFNILIAVIFIAVVIFVISRYIFNNDIFVVIFI